MKGFISFMLALLLAAPAFAQGTTTTISRLQLDHPDLNYPGGTALHTAVANLYQKIGDNMNSRYKEFTGVADSTTTTWTHNFGVAYSEMSCFLYTGAAPSLTRVPLPISTAGWTIAANGTNPLTQVDITTPSSGGPHNFAVMCVQGYMPERVDDLKNVDLSSPAVDGQALVYNGTSGKWNAGASGDASFKLQTVSTSTLTLKGGYLILSDGRELATYSGSGSTSTSFGVDITANLSTVLGASPANATTYYLYVDLSTLSSTTTTDTGRKVYGVTSANLSLQTAAPDAVLRSRYVPVGLVRSATTGTAWTGTGSAFRTLAVRRHEDNPIAVSPTVFTQGPSVVSSVGTAGQVAAGHVITAADFPVTTGKIAIWNLSANANDSSGALSCTAGTAACNLTNNGSVGFTATDILGNTSAAAALSSGSSQSFSSTSAFLNPGSASFAFGVWVYRSAWTGQSTTLIGNNPGSDAGYYIYLDTTGFLEFASASGSTTISAFDTPVLSLPSGWHFIAETVSGTTLKGYIDGKQVITGTLAGAQRTITSPDFRIGAKSGGTQFLTGNVGNGFFVNGQSMSDDDIRKLYAATVTHNANVLPQNQLWSATYQRADGLVSQNLSSSWLVSKGANTLYYDLSDLPATAQVTLKLQDAGLSPYVIPARNYDSGYLSAAPATTIAHGLGDIPTQVKVFYEETTGQFVEEPNGAYCSATSTNLVCDWTGLTISSSNRVRVTASAAMAPSVAVPPADATTGGIVTTSAQTIAGAKTFNGQVNAVGGFSLDGSTAFYDSGSFTLSFTGPASSGPYTFNYSRVGKSVTIYSPSGSNQTCAVATFFQSTASVPASLVPVHAPVMFWAVQDSSTAQTAPGQVVITTGGIMQFVKNNAVSNFTASGTCGWYSGDFTYTLN